MLEILRTSISNPFGYRFKVVLQEGREPNQEPGNQESGTRNRRTGNQGDGEPKTWISSENNPSGPESRNFLRNPRTGISLGNNPASERKPGGREGRNGQQHNSAAATQATPTNTHQHPGQHSNAHKRHGRTAHSVSDPEVFWTLPVCH